MIVIDDKVSFRADLVVFDNSIWQEHVEVSLALAIQHPPDPPWWDSLRRMGPSKIVGTRFTVVGCDDARMALIHGEMTMFDAWQRIEEAPPSFTHVLHVYPNVRWRWDDRAMILHGEAQRGPNVAVLAGAEVDLGGYAYVSGGPS